MKRVALTIAMIVGFSVALFAQTAAKPAGSNDLKITKGPTVEFVGSDRAIIAWSTDASSGTVVHYGTQQDFLSQKALAPWGALTHRVTLKNLQPNTKYYFKVDSEQGAGTGTRAESSVLEFQTKAPDAATMK